jgi:hypothetical protein
MRRHCRIPRAAPRRAASTAPSISLRATAPFSPDASDEQRGRVVSLRLRRDGPSRRPATLFVFRSNMFFDPIDVDVFCAQLERFATVSARSNRTLISR